MVSGYNFLFKSFDKGVFETFFVKSPISFFNGVSLILKSFLTADINQYIFYIVNIAAGVLVFYFFFELNYPFSLMIIFYFIYKYLLE